MYAEVALIPALPGKDLLTYGVEEADRARILPGVRVVVPLGRRRETGLVVALTSTPPPGLTSIRRVVEVLDSEPVFTPELIALCRWASDYYVTTLADALAAALPGGLRASSARVVRPANAGDAPQSSALGPASPPAAARTTHPSPTPARRRLEAAILAYLHANGPTTTKQLARAIEDPAVARTIRALAARGTVIVEDVLRAPAAKIRLLNVFVLTRELTPEEAEAIGRRAPRQRAIYERLLGAAERRLDASALTLGERTAADGLVRRGVAARLRAERYRDARPPARPETPPPTLTAEQQAAVDAVVGAADFQVFLLHGVTGSGKTEVYLQLAARARAAGRSVLMLVPEIALTHQLVLRVQERFGSGVALLHSGLGPGERWDEWRRIARGEAGVVVGARSAVFAPLAALGLVIVDEEHDTAYKQDEGLRYNARDLALVRAKLAGARAVLGSATPSIESYHRALDGKFRLLPLTCRVEGRTLPEVELIDLRRPAPGLSRSPQAPSTPFSPRLLAAIGTTLERREQVLLFLNRRGFATSLQCLACGEPAGCPACSVSLTLHERRGVLLCHHCGYARPSRSPCAACGNAELRTCGEGTERIEAEVARLFPAARIGRLDRDTTARRGAHRRILDAWNAGALDVLIGTQMVAKGHDVPGVTLVGVLLADVALNMPDFRAAERAFQLLTQVAGRAGRGDVPGRVLVQTYRPEHHSLRAAAAHDYQGFAPHELALRRELGYPPFTRLAVLRLEGADPAATERAATELASRGRAAAAGSAVTVRGPAAAPLERLRGRYRWQILLSSASARALRDLLRHLLTTWHHGSATRKIRLVVDMDPVSML